MQSIVFHDGMQPRLTAPATNASAASWQLLVFVGSATVRRGYAGSRGRLKITWSCHWGKHLVRDSIVIIIIIIIIIIRTRTLSQTLKTFSNNSIRSRKTKTQRLIVVFDIIRASCMKLVLL